MAWNCKFYIHPHQGWIAARAPNRLNSKHMQNILHFFDFPDHAKITWNGTKWGQKDVFLLIQTLPTFWATRILILRICIFCFVGGGFQISRFHISQFPDFQIPTFPDSQVIQISSLPNAAGTAGRTLRSQPDPLPTHPLAGIKYVAGSPCCD